MNSPLDRLFNPRAIAVVGATQDPRRPGGQALKSLTTLGYTGEVYAVNPRYSEIEGRVCHASVDELPAVCDLAVIGVPAREVPETIAACGRKGISHAVILSAGFRETAERGAPLEARLQAALKTSGVRAVGPNCIGMMSLRSRVFAGFGAAFRKTDWRGGPVAMISQSGGFAYSIMTYCARVFRTGKRARGNRCAVVTTPGGAGVLLTDVCERHGLELPPMAEHTQAKLKTVLPDFASLANPIDVTAAVAQKEESFSAAQQAVLDDPGVHIRGWLIEEMASGAELITGAVNNAPFGPVILVGLGGVQAEVLKDVARTYAPLSVAQAKELILRLKGASLLRGFRGQPAADLDALADAVSRVSWLIADHADVLAEVEINPLLAGPHGVSAVDAMTRCRAP